MFSEHFLKIILPNWILGSVAIYFLVFHFSWLFVLYSVLGFYVLGIFGASIGFHRYLTHQSFKTSKFFDWLMIICGSLTGQGSPIFWVALHKFHHKNSDAESDIHSPNRGFWNSVILWQIKKVQPIQAMANRKMYTHPLIKFIHRNYYKFYWLSVLAVYIINPMFGLFFMSFGGWFLIAMFENLGNYALHSKFFGYRNYDLPDSSRNVPLNAYITLGGGWHNNHHRWPGNYRFGEKWWEFDVSARIIELIKK
jgi:fatty-acid desaturase